MKIYHYGLHYDEESRRIELVTYGVFAEPDTIYSPEWLYSFLSDRIHLERARLDRDILVSLNNRGCVAALYFIQNGAQCYTRFSQRLTLLYALLSFRAAFVFVHYKANAARLPTVQDDAACRSLKKTFASLSLKLFDFLLIGEDGLYSYREQKNLSHQTDRTATISMKNDRAA